MKVWRLLQNETAFTAEGCVFANAFTQRNLSHMNTVVAGIVSCHAMCVPARSCRAKAPSYTADELSISGAHAGVPLFPLWVPV